MDALAGATTGTGGAGGAGGAAGGATGSLTEVCPLSSWVILMLTRCRFGGGAFGGSGRLSTISASTTGSSRAS